jgi:drug/metabolite transporter (DMT)-like permease
MTLSNLAYGGEIAALTAALLWACASVFFDRAGRVIGSVELNLIKGLVALVFLFGTALVSGSVFANLETRAIILLVISGVVGIGFGDTVFFRALEHMGPRRSLLVSSINPAMTALIAAVFLDEVLPVQAWLGMLVTIAGIAWVITERPGSGVSVFKFPLWGVIYALLSALSQAVGAVLSRAALAETSATPLQSTILRLCAGLVVLVGWILVRRIRIGQWVKGQGAARVAYQTMLATFLGTYLGMWLQQTAYKLSPAGIAQTLTSTSPLFILPIAALSSEKISLRAVIGAALAVVGIMLLFMV